jgi:TRAP-type C4-dicarboxylate transport system permease small subunit
MRRVLDSLYLGCGVLAAVSILAITALVMAQVTATLIDRIAALVTGRAIGLLVPSYAEFTGFFLVAASFLALPYAFRAGAHIRVGLVIANLPPGLRRVADIWILAVGLALSAFAAWWAVDLTRESIVYGDQSSGLVPVPLWIPQGSMALGLVVLSIALADDLVQAVRGRPLSFDAAAPEP